MSAPLRVCITHLRHAWSGGAERYLNYLARGLCERGHEVTIACRSHAEPPHPDVKFKRLRAFAIGNAWRYWAFARSLERYFKRYPDRYDVVFGLGRTWSQDIVRVSGGCHQTWLDMIQQDSAAAATPRLSFKNKMYLRLESRSFAPGAYRKIICNSDMVRRDVMRRYAVPDECIEVIHNGVDLQRFNPANREVNGASIRREAGFNEEHIVFIFLGTGFERKGLDLVLAAFGKISNAVANARVMVVGRDSRQAAYKQQARDLGIADKVVFLGERLDAQDCLTAGDVLVLPTRYDPFANVTVEALASGLPVITSDTNGGSEVITGDQVGSVLHMGTNVVDDLAAAMRAWSEPARIELAVKAARQVAEEHAIDSKLDAALDVIINVAQGQPHAA